MLGVEARLAKTDAMLLLTAVAAMGAMARIYLRERRDPGAIMDWILPAIFWTALAGGVLLKGPLILMFVVLAAGTLAVVDRSARWLLALRPLYGIAWLALLVMPWFIAIVARAGDSFFVESVGRDMLNKVASGQESHGAPPGILFRAVLGHVLAGRGARRNRGAGSLGSAARAGRTLPARLARSGWIVFELVVTKLPHYVLPLCPAIAILIAGIIDTRSLARQPWLTRGTGWWFGFPLIAGIGAVVGLVIVARALGLAAWPFLAGAMVFGFLAWWLYAADGAERSLLRAVIASILLAIGIYAVIIPYLGVSPGVALAQALREAGCSRPVAATAGFHEPSLVFLAGTSTRLTDGAGAAEFLRPGGCRFAFVESRHERSFAQRAEALGLRYTQGPRVEGINLGSARRVTIAVYRAAPSPAEPLQ